MMTTTERPRVAILISGRGSNLAAILEAAHAIPATFACVVSSRDDAPGLHHARAHGVPTYIVERARGETRDDYARRLLEPLAETACTHVVLAGFMQILGDPFLAAYPRRIVNIHPSLLPAFPGLDPHRRAIEAGAHVSGCTVHLVEPGEIDGGRVLAQVEVPVFSEDDADTLEARVLRAEHELYPTTLATFFEGFAQEERGSSA